MTLIYCHYCGAQVMQSAGSINRASRAGRPIYCNRACAGLARRDPSPPTPEQKKEAKRLYDLFRRHNNLEKLKAQKRDYYYRTRNPEKDRIRRKINMHKHVAYCRRPEYRIKKQAYDQKRQSKLYGEFSEAWLLLRNVEKEVEQRSTRYQIKLNHGTINKAQKRRRAL